jgi:hypothetical protein
MSKINTYGDDQTDSMAASLAPTNTKQNTELVPEGYIRYADGTLEKFEEEEIWGQAKLVSVGPSPTTGYLPTLDDVEDL